MALQPSSKKSTADANELDGSTNCCGPDEPPDRSHSPNCNRMTSGSRNPAVMSSSQQLQNKKSSFQITCVVPKPEGDSMDDLDDVTNTEDVSSEMHAAENTRPDHWSSAETIHSPCETSPRSPSRRRASAESSSQPPDPQSRFRIVKVESRAPTRVRGRWTCMDFSDPPLVSETSSSEGTSTGENAGAVAAPIFFVDNALQVPFTPAFVYSGDHYVLERAPLNSLADNNIYDSHAAERNPVALNGGLVTSGIERLEAVTSLSDLADAVGRPGDFAAFANAALMPSDSTDNADSGTFAIDNKIEQAMDLVKSHLMFAVHEEVELLKEQIKDLMVKNARLEHENTILRAAASNETLAHLEANPAPMPTAAGGGSAVIFSSNAGPPAPS